MWTFVEQFVHPEPQGQLPRLVAAATAWLDGTDTAGVPAWTTAEILRSLCQRDRCDLRCESRTGTAAIVPGDDEPRWPNVSVSALLSRPKPADCRTDHVEGSDDADPNHGPADSPG